LEGLDPSEILDWDTGKITDWGDLVRHQLAVAGRKYGFAKVTAVVKGVEYEVDVGETEPMSPTQQVVRPDMAAVIERIGEAAENRDHDDADVERDDGSACRCPRCGYVATEGRFREAGNAATGGSCDDAGDLPTEMGKLEQLTGKKWREVDGPESGVGLDWYYETEDGTLAAWLNLDQDWVTLKIESLVAEDGRREGIMPCGKLAPNQVDHYSPNLVFEMQGDSTDVPWLL
jgi:hypothetical protein